MTNEELKAWQGDHQDDHIELAAMDSYIELNGLEYVTIQNFEEAYVGAYESDEHFARETAENSGELPKDNTWPFYCIDWEWAAQELMTEYDEQGGHYFRNM